MEYNNDVEIRKAKRAAWIEEIQAPSLSNANERQLNDDERFFASRGHPRLIHDSTFHLSIAMDTMPKQALENLKCNFSLVYITSHRVYSSFPWLLDKTNSSPVIRILRVFLVKRFN